VSNSDEIAVLRNSLHKRANYLKHKFQAARQFEIDDEYVKEILQDLTKLEKISPVSTKQKIKGIKSICAATITFYREPEHRSLFYFDLENKIVPLLEEI
jgi:hypothetical protein